jgi:hypothetical protein
MNTCLARTRSGGICQLKGNPKNGRCHLHGGASTGPKTAEGRARIAAAHLSTVMLPREQGLHVDEPLGPS